MVDTERSYDAYGEGYDAYLAGVPFHQNIYDVDGDEYDKEAYALWADGWAQAQDDDYAVGAMYDAAVNG